jgi:hypothetical protein
MGSARRPHNEAKTVVITATLFDHLPVDVVEKEAAFLLHSARWVDEASVARGLGRGLASGDVLIRHRSVRRLVSVSREKLVDHSCLAYVRVRYSS